ncbi:MAG: helix-turn-helix transcriptional regulator [Candidatus Caccovivens sp.]
MAFNSNGQISYLVLDSLSSGSKYGLEIIEYISQKTGGTFILKKPSLYSCLTRMEKKGLVSSSYWGESEMGGKRHYYTITDSGRQNLEELAKEFSNEYINVENDIKDDGKLLDSNERMSETSLSNNTTEQSRQHEEASEPIFLQQGNIFDIVKEENQTVPVLETKEEQTDILENQLDLFNLPPIENKSSQLEKEKIEYYQTKLEQEHSKESFRDDAKLLTDDEKMELTPYQNEQNRRLYDTSSELKKYRKRKSFSENQIEMSVVYERDEDQAIQKDRIEQLKQSMLNIRQNGFNQIENEHQSESTYESKLVTNQERPLPKEVNQEENEQKDDAIFITNPRINESDIPIQRKITPPNIEVNIYDDNLPAPKRNSNLEPTYKDMMAKLFERKKEKKDFEPQITSIQETNETAKSFADYGTLKNYYKNHGIEFKEYNKTSVERKHNTNFLNFISSTILLLLAGIGSALLFWIISATGNLQSSTNFMFYTVPILFFVYFIYTLIKWRASSSKKAVLIYNSIINWAVFILGSLIVFVINISCGMQYETIWTYSTSIFLPILAIFVAFPVNYYIKKLAYKKFSK